MDEPLLHLLRAIALRHVADDPDDPALSLRIQQTDTDLRRKLGSVFAPARQLAGDRPRRRRLSVIFRFA